MAEVNSAVEETKIDIVSTIVSSFASSHDNPQVQILLEKSNSSSFNGISLENMVTSNSNAHVIVIDQPNVDTSLPEVHLNSLGVVNDDDSGLIFTSQASAAQLSQQQISLAPSGVTQQSSELHVPSLKKESKMGVWMSMISSGSIVSVLSGLVGNRENSTNNNILAHKITFQTFITLNYVAFVLAVGLFLLILTRPKIPGLVTIVKVAMWIALGSITYALGSATYMIAFTLK